MLNIQGLMKQAQIMQKKMQETQARLSQEEREGTAGGGLVKVTLNGRSEMKKISIDKSTPSEYSFPLSNILSGNISTLYF